MSRLSVGDFVVDLGAELKLTSSLIDPSRIPKELTVEDIFVI